MKFESMPCNLAVRVHLRSRPNTLIQ